MAGRRDRPRRALRPLTAFEVGKLERALTLYREEARLSVERWLDSEERVKAATLRYRSLYENVTIGYMRLDRSGTILDINRAGCALLGVAAGRHITGKPLLVFADSRHTQAMLRHLMRCRDGEPVIISSMLVRDTGREVELVSTRAFQTPGVVEFNTYFTDLTERETAKQAVRDSERRFRGIVETANEGICTVDGDDRITFVNLRFARMLGGEVGDFAGSTMSSHVHPEDVERAKTAFERRRFGIAGLMELRLCRRDRSTLWTSVSSSVLTDGDGSFAGVLRMFSDITDRKELEAMRERLVKHLVDAQEAERRRIARELHDQTAQHLIGLTLGLDSLATAAAESSDVRRIAQRLQELAGNLSRDVHRLAVELRPAALDDLGLAAAVGNYADAISSQFGLTVDLHCTVGSRLDPSVETTVYRVVQEALTNVVRHASAHLVSIIIEAQAGYLRVVVEDDGIGFDESRGPKADGHGLGIIGMRERAALVGGDLTIESSDGSGTTIFLRVPLPPEAAIHHEETARAVGG